MSIAFSGCKTQIPHPHFRPNLPHYNISPALLPYPKGPISFTTSSSLLHHDRHRFSPLEFLTGRCPARLGSSLLTQDPILDEEEEETDGGGSRGSDWGQQDEVSDDEEEKEKLTGFGEGGRRGGFSVPPEGARLFVGNLPFDVGSEELAGIFQQAGEIEVAEVIYNRETDRSRGFGFVTMRTVEEAEKAIDMFNNYDLNGRLLAVNKASRRGSQPIRAAGGFRSNRRIFVGNLPWQVDSARLEQVFGEHGKVLEARVVYETDSGRSRGFGFVKMSTDKEIDNAITNLDGKNLEGRPIRVNVAEERPRRSF